MHVYPAIKGTSGCPHKSVNEVASSRGSLVTLSWSSISAVQAMLMCSHVVWLLSSKNAVLPVGQRPARLPHTHTLVCLGAACRPGTRSHDVDRSPAAVAVGDTQDSSESLAKSWGNGGGRGLVSPCQPRMPQEPLLQKVGF